MLEQATYGYDVNTLSVPKRLLLLGYFRHICDRPRENPACGIYHENRDRSADR